MWPLYKRIIAAGVSQEFAREAIKHTHLFQGDVPAFVRDVRAVMDKDPENALNPESNQALATGSLDQGSKTVEADYTGDVLTHWGFDHQGEDRRW
jgi:hypothetical protein